MRNKILKIWLFIINIIYHWLSYIYYHNAILLIFLHSGNLDITVKNVDLLLFLLFYETLLDCGLLFDAWFLCYGLNGE